jgi:hypothetical protein
MNEIKEDQTCTICGRVANATTIRKYDGKPVTLCDHHSRVYAEAITQGEMVTSEKHCDLIEEMITQQQYTDMDILKKNAEYMSNVMRNWEDGLLLISETVNKIALLADESRTIALNMKGGD